VFEERVELKTGKSGVEVRKESQLRGDVVSAEMRKEGGRYFSIKGHVVGRKEKSVEEETRGLKLACT
jgi:hypothetical protein